jgi:hypothetical protein
MVEKRREMMSDWASFLTGALAGPTSHSERESLLELQCAVDAAGFDAALFRASEKLCGSIKPSDYNHVARAMIFLGRSGRGCNGRQRAVCVDGRSRGAKGEADFDLAAKMG